MVARLTPVKDHATMLKAFARIQGHLILVGDGPERANLEAAARAPDLAGRVHFAGSQGDLRPYYGAAWVVCLTSVDESQPVVLLEAMAARRPIVATRVGGVPEVVVDGETGILVPPRDPQALAIGLRRAATDAAWRKAAGGAGRLRVEERFSIHERARKIEGLIESLVEEACQ
jgi:glycosyltransferase involved in cell wall biosynthesis